MRLNEGGSIIPPLNMDMTLDLIIFIYCFFVCVKNAKYNIPMAFQYPCIFCTTIQSLLAADSCLYLSSLYHFRYHLRKKHHIERTWILCVCALDYLRDVPSLWSKVVCRASRMKPMRAPRNSPELNFTSLAQNYIYIICYPFAYMRLTEEPFKRTRISITWLSTSATKNASKVGETSRMF